MSQENLYGILRDITKSMSVTDPTIKILPAEINSSASLESLGLDIVS
jgi:hypothetical protein